MPPFLTAASDIFVIASAAAVATVALNSKIATLKISVGSEYDEDSLVGAEANDSVGTLGQHRPPLQKNADDNKKAPTVTVTEVAVTPPLTEIQGDDFFASAKAA